MSLGPITLADPAVQTALVPFLVALALALGFGMVRGGGRWAGLAAGLGFLVAFVLFEGLPSFPPPAAKQKVFYLAAAGLIAGVALDALAARRALFTAAAAAFALACVAWLGWRRLEAGPDTAFALLLAAAAIGGIVFLAGLTRAGGVQDALAAEVILIAAALTAAMIALEGASASLALLCAALAAATGGAALRDYLALLLRDRRQPLSGAFVLGAGGTLVALGGVMVLYTPQVNTLALAVAALIPLAGAAAARALSAGSRLGRAVAPLALAVVVAVPALAAFALVRFLA